MRTIFHCDINNCFVGIETAMDPGLRGRPVAVCGDPASRRGIVLAKSEEAKACGVKTGDPLWMAREKCPGIHFVRPHYEVYSIYSMEIRRYYQQFSPRVEPFGLDECWLDMSSMEMRGTEGVCARALSMAEDIWNIFGVTVSIGVSFNKIFAKLGSDLRKPSGITLIDKSRFREQIWGLPASSMLGVGRRTSEILGRVGIHTIGQLAEADEREVRRLCGKNGVRLRSWANGEDTSPVSCGGETAEMPESVGRSTTLPWDVYSPVGVSQVMEMLSERVAFELQSLGLRGYGIQVTVRDGRMVMHQYQRTVERGLSTSREISGYGCMMLSQRYDWGLGVHAVGVRLYHLGSCSEGRQLSLFGADELENRKAEEKERRTDGVIRQIQFRYGDNTIQRGYDLNGVSRSPANFPGVSFDYSSS